MHSIFEEFLVILAKLPALSLHLLSEAVEAVRVIVLRVVLQEFAFL